MHILFLTGEYPPLPGGVGAYTQALGRALVEQGARVGVVTARAAGPRPVTGDSTEDGIELYPVVERWRWRGVHALGNLARDLGADWLHVQYQTAAFAMHPAINFAPGVWRSRPGAIEGQPFRTAWTYHDLLVPYLFPKAGNRLRRWVTLRPAHTADLVITTNEGDWRQVAGGGWQGTSGELPLDEGIRELTEDQVISNKQSAIRNARLAKISIGSNIRGRHLSTAERRARRREQGYGDDDFVLAYFGFLNRSKGGETLIRTLHALLPALPNARLLMIGERVGASDPTNHGYLQEIEALVDALGLAERVQWTGHQTDAAVAADLNACDVLLMPYVDGASLRRGTLMAGLANGCAIVTTTPSAPLPELVHERDWLLVPPVDVAAARDAVLRLARDPALAASLRENARSRGQLFAWPQIAAEHVALYSRRGRA